MRAESVSRMRTYSAANERPAQELTSYPGFFIPIVDNFQSHMKALWDQAKTGRSAKRMTKGQLACYLQARRVGALRTAQDWRKTQGGEIRVGTIQDHSGLCGGVGFDPVTLILERRIIIFPGSAFAKSAPITARRSRSQPARRFRGNVEPRRL